MYKYCRILWLGILLPGLAFTTPAVAQPYHVAETFKLGGDGGWDYLTLDHAAKRLYIGRHDRVMVVDPARGTLIGEVRGLDHAHGVALDEAAGRGFATSGGDGKLVIFDLKSLKVLGRAEADADADAIMFEPVTRRIFSFNGDAHTASVVDPLSGERLATIKLGAKPEFGVADGQGRIFVNLESSAEIAEIDAAAMRVMRKWPLASCTDPTGLAIDTAHHLLFSGCRNGIMAVSDSLNGKPVARVPIGSGVDACRFDAVTGLAFASTGDGAITVIHEDSPAAFSVVQTVATQAGARTMELDPATHRLYTVSAERQPPSASDGGHHPPVIPGTFTLFVLEQ